MATYALVRFEVRADARAAAERALHDHAAYVRRELRDVTWTAYRDPAAPQRYTAMVRYEGRALDPAHHAAFVAAMTPFVAGEIELTGCELVTSSDLQRRRR